MMEKLKKIIIATSGIFGCFLLFYALHLLSEYGQEEKSRQWQSYHKSSDGKVSARKITEVDRAESKLDDHPTPKSNDLESAVKKAARSPANKKKDVIGHSYQKALKPLNTPKAGWKDRMASSLLRFLKTKTKLFIKKEESFLQRTPQGLIHVEKVLVKMSAPDGKRYSYNALVDSQTGQVIQSWNRTIHENLKGEVQRYRATGAITAHGPKHF